MKRFTGWAWGEYFKIQKFNDFRPHTFEQYSKSIFIFVTVPSFSPS